MSLRAATKSPKPKSAGQVRAIFGLAREVGHGHEDIHDVIAVLTRQAKHSIRDLTFAEANAVIEHYNGRAFTPVPRRTVQYRRAKQGIKQIVSPAQLKLIADLASQRNWTVDSIEKLCKRMHVPFPLRTTENANKIIEALKKMNKREGLWAA